MSVEYSKAMKIATSSTPATVGELLQYLEELKAAWSEDDTEFLGSFESQTLCIATHDGIAKAIAKYDAFFGVVLHTKKNQ